MLALSTAGLMPVISSASGRWQENIAALTVQQQACTEHCRQQDRLWQRSSCVATHCLAMPPDVVLESAPSNQLSTVFNQLSPVNYILRCMQICTDMPSAIVVSRSV
jgi:hypothetical protein